MILLTKRSLIPALLTLGLGIGIGLADPLAALGQEGSDHKTEHKDHEKDKADKKSGEGSDRKAERRETRDAEEPRRKHADHDDDEQAGSGRKDREQSERADKPDKGEQDEEAALDRKASYAFGMMFGSQLQGAEFDLDDKQFMEGFRTAMAGEEPAMSQREAMQVLQAWQQRQMAAAEEKAAAEAGKQTEANEAFLTENAAKDDVTTTDSGMQYKVLREGKEGAPKVGEQSTITVHYKGELLDGTVFDQTEQGRPATIDLGEQQLIEGWMEALSMMRKGDKWRLFIPPSLGYGNRAMGQIPPGSLLVFDLELVDVAAGDDDEDTEAEDAVENWDIEDAEDAEDD